VEQRLKSSRFVKNDIYLTQDQCLLLTGPNMAGKSTLMRQVALIAIMAQIGSFVPAQKATLPIFDKIYTRIGANDSIGEGLSTFMVEMQETAELLKESTANSLLILDEIGRGTSTYDGLSLAQGILEYIVQEKKCLTFFATHYHELVALAEKFKSILPAHMRIAEENGEIAFLHELALGSANRSYGIHVAKLAGIPKSILARAEVLLKAHENDINFFAGLVETDQISKGGPHPVTSPEISRSTRESPQLRLNF
jgi:DNA mismatch repair protein MutS